MITGFNTDVEYEGRVFHVQTEDKGRDNPVVESLVYSGGEIVASRRASYGELVRSPRYSEAEVLKRMESQHLALIRDIRNGRFDPDGPKPFGAHIISNRSFDEVVMDFLSQEVGVERIRLEIEGDGAIVEGSRPTLKLRVVAESSDRPVGGARVTVRLLSTQERAREVFCGETGPDGRLEASFEIPPLPGASAALLFQAEAAGNNAEIQQPVHRTDLPYS